ncbi:butyrylcholinesterase-like [Planoprotostelium fungivorum]|uniref:Butyrylcholinesterase-like n=1 Tax=Planoprotostelium fungivorum TaxID=1890364 RepID=A0A2P6N3R6_9EUKA|nr:butyrylcholinesterase-like [Planoprotostelium fungivorum]
MISAVVLLTDGQPTTSPPKGEAEATRAYIEKNAFPGSVSTFGFGYGINTKMLSGIAKAAQGNYTFIPDSTILGTAFVNWTSNFLSSAANRAILSLEPLNGATFSSSQPDASHVTTSHTKSSADTDAFWRAKRCIFHIELRCDSAIGVFSSLASVANVLSYNQTEATSKTSKFLITTDTGRNICYRVVNRRFQLKYSSPSPNMPPKAFETPADLAQAAKDYGRDTWREQMSYISQTGGAGHPQEQLNGLDLRETVLHVKVNVSQLQDTLRYRVETGLCRSLICVYRFPPRLHKASIERANAYKCFAEDYQTEHRSCQYCRSENLFLRTGVAWSPGTAHNERRQQDETVVETTNGKIKGVEGEDHFAWKGVPFAAPPVGTNRWKAPQPIQSWTDTLNTIEYAPGCPQWCLLPARFCPNITSESCLFLNVFSPKNASGSPVMFYLAGGGFAMGDASSEVYDSARLAAKTGNVVVLANYRLGPLGWLVKGSIRGNFGLMDQHAALTWVQQNIVHFGGDPSKVTIFGESAGGMSIGAHLISRYSKGLFHRAIIQSNPLATSFKTPLVAATWGNTFSALVGCTFGGEKCLRSKTAEEITSASKFVPPFPSHLNLNGSTISLPWDPTVDGDWVPEQVLTAANAGRFHQVPLIIGSNAEEGWMFVTLVYKIPMFNTIYIAAITGAFGTNAFKVLRKYPPPLNPFADCRPAFARLVTDAIFTCPSRRFAEVVANQTDTYVYEFNHKTEHSKWLMGDMTFCNDHVCHGAELPYVFGTLPQFTSSERGLSDTMQSAWGNFAKDGVPSEDWPKFSGDAGKGRRAVEFAIPSIIQDDYKSNVCDFWDSIGYDVK